MRITRSAALAAVLCAALAGGCKKNPEVIDTSDKGTTPGDSTGDRTQVEPRTTPDTPDLRERTVDPTDQALKDVLFDFDRYDIRADQRPVLDGNGEWLKTNRQNVLIEGHCDERGTEEYNLALGDRRAKATKDYLRTLGIPADRMSTISYGEAYPVDPGHNEGAWARNRRAHFTLVSGSGR